MLIGFDKEIKLTSHAYFRAAKDALDLVAKYNEVKFAAETPYMTRASTYNKMRSGFDAVQEKESIYRQTVVNAN